MTSGRADDILREFLHSRLPRSGRAGPEDLDRLRTRALNEVFLRGFPEETVRSRPRVEWTETLTPASAYSVRKLRYEAFPGYWVPALLYAPTAPDPGARLPAVLNPGGHCPGGKAAEYVQVRCANLARRGMLALNIEFIGMGELGGDRDHNRLSYLELVGLAAPGLMYLALQKGLDVLLDHPAADPQRVAVTGLSGGGWQTIAVSALDTRVTASVPVAGYTTIDTRIDHVEDIGDLEQVPSDLTRTLDYSDLTAMLVPRPALIVLNENDDCCFATERTKPVVYDAIAPRYEALGLSHRFEFHNNSDPGTHNYDADNRSALYRFLNRHFGLDFPEHDIHKPAELYTEEQLRVGLPVDQHTVWSIALARARTLRASRSPAVTAEAKSRLRQRIAAAIRLPALAAGDSWPEGPEHFLAGVGPWLVPVTVTAGTRDEIAVELVESRPAAALIGMEDTRGVVAVDVLGTGMLRSEPRLQMLIGCVGERMLGLQVAQLLAVVRSLAENRRPASISLAGKGLTASFVALVAAALEPDLFTTLTVTGGLMSLEHLIEQGVPYQRAQSLFCFGLLEVVDVPDLVGLLDDITYLQADREVLPA